MEFSSEERARFWGLELHRRRAFRLRRRLEELPAAHDEIEGRLAAARAAYEQALADKRGLEMGQKKLELEVESVKERRGRHQQQLLNASDNREYATLLKEIESERGKQDELELRILEIMESLEELRPRLEVDRRKLEELERESAERLATLEAEELGLKTRLKRLEEGREGLLAGLTPAGRRMVEKLESQGLSGHICAEVSNYRCGVCGMEIATQALSEVRAGKLRQCESCSSMLYDEDQLAATRSQARNRGFLPPED